MRATYMIAPGKVEVRDVDKPVVIDSTDAVLQVAAACICGSDLWPYRGVTQVDNQPMGHEYVGTIVELGEAVEGLEIGDFVVGSFCLSDNTCEICASGYPSRCTTAAESSPFISGAQAQYLRVPFADGTLVKVPGGRPEDPDVLASLLAASDVLGTGWFGAVAAEAGPGKTVVVVGDGAVGLSAVLAARELGAERVIAMSRNPQRQAIAREFGATDIVEERGEAGVARIREMTGGLGAHSVVEAVGLQESMLQAIGCCRPGGHVGFVGVAHEVEIPGMVLFGAEVHLFGGPAPVRSYLPDLIERILSGRINPGRVFDMKIPLEKAPEGYVAMDERRAIKVLLEM